MKDCLACHIGVDGGVDGCDDGRGGDGVMMMTVTVTVE